MKDKIKAFYAKNTKKRAIITAVTAIIIIMLIIPPLREILLVLFVIALFVGFFILAFRMKKTLKNVTKKKFPKLIAEHPNVWKYFGTKSSAMCGVLPGYMLNRATWRQLPGELRGSDPLLAIDPELILPSNPSYIGFNAKYGARVLEDSTLRYTVLSSLVKMSDTLGIGSGSNYNKIVKLLGEIELLAEQDGLQLWFIEQNLSAAGLDMGIVKTQLQIICSVMEINYDLATPDENYTPGSSSFYGVGSWGMVGLGAALSIGSKLSAAAKKAGFNMASTFIAFNNITDYFNSRYYPEEYAALQAGQEAPEISGAIGD